jgi:hypothetical protein
MANNFYFKKSLKNNKNTILYYEWINIVNTFNNPLTPTKYRIMYCDFINLKCYNAYFIVNIYDYLHYIDWSFLGSIKNINQSTIYVYIYRSIDIYSFYLIQELILLLSWLNYFIDYFYYFYFYLSSFDELSNFYFIYFYFYYCYNCLITNRDFIISNESLLFLYYC